MGVSVAFDYTSWVAMFPQFSALTSPQVTNLILPYAEVYCANDGSGPVYNTALQTSLLNLIVAHCAQLMFGANPTTSSSTGTGNAPAPVGMTVSASEGSVSASFSFPTTPNNAWFAQTQYGIMFWQACASLRTARYLPNPVNVGPVIGPYPGAWNGLGTW